MFACGECDEPLNDCDRLNLLSTPELLSRTTSSLFLETKIIDLSGDPTDFGFTWSINPAPAIEKGSARTPSQEATGGFNENRFRLSINNLQPDTEYFVRPFVFVNNNIRPSYGDEMSFRTSSVNLNPNVLIQVTTGAVSAISSDRARVEGEIRNLSSDSIVDHGFCWSAQNELPTLIDSTLALGSLQVSSTQVLSTFEKELTQLSPNTTYFVRAYAKIMVSGQESTIYHMGNTEFKTSSN